MQMLQHKMVIGHKTQQDTLSAHSKLFNKWPQRGGESTQIHKVKNNQKNNSNNHNNNNNNDNKAM